MLHVIVLLCGCVREFGVEVLDEAMEVLLD